MTDSQADILINLVKQLLEETQKNNNLLEDVKNLFQKYDNDLLLEDEMLREG